MRIDSISLALRPRSVWEGCDLGVRLLQASMRPVFGAHLAVALPLFALFLLTYPIAGWLPAVLTWLSKPWLDRTVLFVLSRALFSRRTAIEELWRHRREVWFEGLSVTLTSQRLSASRSFRQPVLQLEGLSGKALKERIRHLTTRHRGVARAVTLVFANAEFALVLSLVSLKVWLSPHSLGDSARLGDGVARADPAADDLGRLPCRRGISRALLRRCRVRHVHQSPRRARGLGHRAGIPPCVRRLTP